MDCKLTIIDMRGALPQSETPLMLRELLFCPVLSWVGQELAACGVQRYFVICAAAWQEQAREALVSCGGELRLFTGLEEAVEAAEEPYLLLPEPVAPVYGPEEPLYALCGGVKESADPAALWQRDTTPPSFRPIHSAVELTLAMPAARELLTRRMIEGGVHIIDPANTYVDPRCTVEPGAVLLPGCILRGHTRIGGGCVIGPNSMLTDCVVGRDTTVNASQLTDSTVGNNTTVGPFAYVRPGCTIGDHCRVGDFVEMKNSTIGDGTKISHLTYVGDSDVGQRVNFGCGTVTTNYDGHKKFRCTIGDDVFLGCNTNLIAPVCIGDRAYTAAGSTVTGDVPAGALAIARARQVNKDGWADRLRKSWKKN